MICKEKIDKFIRVEDFSIYYLVRFKKYIKIRNQDIVELNNLNIKFDLMIFMIIQNSWRREIVFIYILYF